VQNGVDPFRSSGHHWQRQARLTGKYYCGFALTQLGVSRIGYGPIPYIRAMDALKQEASKVHNNVSIGVKFREE
jgi:hypothetical protein